MPRSKTATRRSARPRFHRSAPGRAASSRSAKIPILCMSALCRGCLFFHHSLSAFTILSRYFVARNNRLIICLDNFKVNLRSPIGLFDFRSSHRNEGKRKTAGKTGRQHVEKEIDLISCKMINRYSAKQLRIPRARSELLPQVSPLFCFISKRSLINQVEVRNISLLESLSSAGASVG